MKLPLQIVYRDLAPLPALDAKIRRLAAKLELFGPELIRCHVAVESGGNRHRSGHRYLVKVDVRVPGAEIVAGEHHADEDMAIAVRGAFEAAARRLEDEARRRRGQVKQHAAPAAATGEPDE